MSLEAAGATVLPFLYKTDKRGVVVPMDPWLLPKLAIIPQGHVRMTLFCTFWNDLIPRMGRPRPRRGRPMGRPQFLWSQAAQDGRLIGCAGDGEEGWRGRPLQPLRRRNVQSVVQ